MRARHEIRFTVLAFVAILLTMAFASVGLLERMSPAIEQILADNVFSVQAVEDMLAVLTRSGAEAPLEPSDVAEFRAAQHRAESNVTEDAEREPLARIEAHRDRALAGDARARETVVDALRELSQINRASIERSDLAAKQLGYSGAWAMVLLGIFALALGWYTIHRLGERITVPLQELESVARAVLAGDSHRRARVVDAPQEFARAAQALNLALDDRNRPLESPTLDAERTLDRATLLVLLEREEARLGPGAGAFVLEGSGRIAAAGPGGEARLSGDDGERWRDRLRRAADADEPGVERWPLPSAAGFICLARPLEDERV